MENDNEQDQFSENTHDSQEIYERILHDGQAKFEWGRAVDARDIFSSTISNYRLQKAKIFQFLQFHPEPEGGFLKTPYLELSMQVKPETRKFDSQAADNQRATLLAIRPLLTAIDGIEGKIDEEIAKPIIQSILGAIRLICHAAEGQILNEKFISANNRDSTLIPKNRGKQVVQNQNIYLAQPSEKQLMNENQNHQTTNDLSEGQEHSIQCIDETEPDTRTTTGITIN